MFASEAVERQSSLSSLIIAAGLGESCKSLDIALVVAAGKAAAMASELSGGGGVHRSWLVVTGIVRRQKGAPRQQRKTRGME